MSDLVELFRSEEKSARWMAEVENATARHELAKIDERCAYLLSQHEPVASLGIDRERLRLVLKYIKHGDVSRLNRDFKELRVTQAQTA